MKVLFICNQNQNRSRTAEKLFKDKFETRSAGLYNEKPVSNKDIAWADAVVAMEEAQLDEISKRFPKPCFEKRLFSLDIPDIYQYNQPELVAILKSKIKDLF